MAAPEHLVVGHVSKAHGTKGELFIWPLTDRPETVYAPGKVLIVGDAHGDVDPGAGTLTVATVRPFKRGLLVRFEGYADRSAVEPLAGRYLLAPVTGLEPLEEGEVFYHQLLGLEVVTADGEVVGRVREVYETAPAHMLEVKGDGRVRLIPFTERIVKQIDLAAGRIVIRPPAGLLDI